VGFGDRFRAWLRGDDAAQGGSGARSSGPAPRGGADGTGMTGRNAGISGRFRSGRRSRGQHPAGGFDGSLLLEFARTRSGVEVYLEPRTNLYGDSVLLVADDGEYLRRPVPDAATVRRFCAEHAIPVYDAARTGYPRRVRDYDRGVRPRRIGLDDLPPWPGTQPESSAPSGGPADGGPPSIGPPASGGASHAGDRSPAGEAQDEDEPPPPPAY
jgi:hypothetical protein